MAQSWTAPQGCTGCTPNRCTWPTDLHTSSPLVQQSSGRAFPEFFRVLLRQLDLTGKVKSFEENWRSMPVYRGLGMLRREMVLPSLSFELEVAEAHLSCGRHPQEISVAEKTASNQHFRCPPPKFSKKPSHRLFCLPWNAVTTGSVAIENQEAWTEEKRDMLI